MNWISSMGLLATILALFSSSAMADTGKGITAYQRGDYALAMRELEAAAAKGDEQADYNLGVAYAEGKAVPQDLTKALGFYTKAAEHGSVLAAFNLGQAYRQGKGTQVDYAQAAHWYETAAKAGDFRAANELGLLYVEGKGVETDLIEGFAWIYPATHASIMDDNAMANAMQLASMLDKSQIDAAQTRGQSYYERYIAPHRDIVQAILAGQ